MILRKTIVIILTFALLSLTVLISCTPTAQLCKIESVQANQFEDKFTYRDSLVSITYEFYLSNGYLTFSIENVSDAPVFIDWKNSMYIPESSQPCAYWIDEYDIEGSSYGYHTLWTSWYATSGGIYSANAVRPDRISMLPPNTAVNVKRFRIMRRLHTLKDPKAIVTQASWMEKNKNVEIYKEEYSYDDSPIRFRNYLTFSKNEDFAKPIHLNFEFWVSEIQEMSAKQVVGSHFFETYSDSIHLDNLHPYKDYDRYFVFKRRTK